MATPPDTLRTTPPEPHTSHRRWWVLGGVALLLSGALVGATLFGGRTDTSADAEVEPLPTAQVVRTDLVQDESVAATLGYGSPSEIRLGGGTITELPAAGTVLDRGSVVARVDGRPVVLFVGDTPLWRQLAPTTPGADGLPVPQVQEGDDVRVVQQNLIDLGVGRGVKVNGRYDSATVAAVTRWQKSLGLEQTGVIEATDVVVRPGPVRVAEQTAKVGDPADGAAIAVTGVQRVVTAQVEVDDRELFTAGDAVRVQLPDGSIVDATVFAVGNVVAPVGEDPTQEPTVDVVVLLADAAAAGDLDQVPVKVLVEKSRAAGVLAVPVNALLALAEGGYAVKVVPDDGGTRLVGVTTGSFADGLVEVTPHDAADLDVDDRVEVPR